MGKLQPEDVALSSKYAAKALEAAEWAMEQQVFLDVNVIELEFGLTHSDALQLIKYIRSRSSFKLERYTYQLKETSSSPSRQIPLYKVIAIESSLHYEPTQRKDVVVGQSLMKLRSC